MHRFINNSAFYVALSSALLAISLMVNYATAAADNIRFEKLNMDEGLSQQSVEAIFQDSQGYMWFGTQEGLNRYDGISFKSYVPEYNNPRSISSLWINSITEDHDGNLWLGTRNGVSMLNRSTETFVRYSDKNAINDKSVRVVKTDRDGTVWVGTRKGLNKFIKDESRFKPYNFVTEDGSHIDIFAIAEDIAGSLWLGTENHGLLRFDPITEQLTFINTQFDIAKTSKRESIRSLFIDENQVLWIGSHGFGLFQLDLKKSKPHDNESVVVKVADLDNKSLLSIEKDKMGTIWIGSFSGLYYKKVGSDSYTKLSTDLGGDDELHNSIISSLFMDRAGVFWVGTFTGLSKWNTRTTQFDHFLGKNGEGYSLSGNGITVIGSINPNQVLVGTTKGLDMVNPITGEIKQIPIATDSSIGIASSAVMATMTVSPEEVWLGHRANGLTKYNPKTQTFKHYPHNPEDPSSISQSGVTSMLKMSDSSLWFGTFGGGLSKYIRETDSFISYKHDPSDITTLSSNRVMALQEGEDGKLWVGTWDAGINLFVPSSETAFRMKRKIDEPTSLGANTILSIFLDSDKNVWIGTQGGGLNLLTQYNIQSGRIEFEKFFTGNGMPSNVVYGIEEGRDGNLWVSTNKGLVKIDRKTKALSVYTSSQGIQANEFHSGAYHKDQNGYLYFGGVNGVTRFNPRNIKPNPIIPNIVFLNFQRLNKFESIASMQNKEGAIEVNYTDYLIGFEFAALDFASPNNNKYKYKLVGFDKDWIEVRDAKRATYTNLPAGTYTFHVIASNSDGFWNNEGNQITLIVEPAPWLSWWAYAIYSLVLLGTVWYIYRYYRKKEEIRANHQIELEHEVNQRTLELSEANQQLLHASITDQLTGLHNRRYLSDVITDTIESIMHEFSTNILNESMTATSGPRLMALMFDLDGFKPINDNYGHEAGDKVIIQVANILKNQSNENDILIRWGGDEYLIVAKVEDLEAATEFAERVRVAIANHAFDVGLANRFHLSSSVGFALYPFSHYAPHSISWDQVHLLADQALYKSKDAGRNTWTGIVQSDQELPFSVLNSLVPNLDQAIAANNVNIVQRTKP